MPDDPNDGYRYRLPANLRQQVGLGRISSDARTRGVVRSGLGIESIERALLNESLTGATNYSSLSSTTWVALDTTNLQWSIWLSGKRPVEYTIVGYVATTATNTLGLSIMLDGTEITSMPLGICGAYNKTDVVCISGTWVTDPPTPGRHTVAVCYKVNGGASGFVQVDSSVHMFVVAKEI